MYHAGINSGPGAYFFFMLISPDKNLLDRERRPFRCRHNRPHIERLLEVRQ
jgi:hypothetical protein